MGEVGCSKDGSFQNLEVNGFASINNTKTMNQQKVIYSRLTITGSAEAEKIFWLPSRGVISCIEIVCVEAPTCGTDSVITYRVGTNSGTGAGGTNDNIVPSYRASLVGAPTVPFGTSVAWSRYSGTLLVAGVGGVAPAQANQAGSALLANRSQDPVPYYLKIGRTVAPNGNDTSGNFAWIVSYKQF